MIILDGQTGLRRSKNPRYFESIGGMYIGMSKNEVLRLYGQPSRIRDGYGWTKEWHYNQENFNVNFAGDTVISISIYKNGNRRFDRTGLSAKDSINTFRYKYNARDILRSSLEIGHGEMITFFDDYVTLEIVREYWLKIFAGNLLCALKKSCEVVEMQQEQKKIYTFDKRQR